MSKSPPVYARDRQSPSQVRSPCLGTKVLCKIHFDTADLITTNSVSIEAKRLIFTTTTVANMGKKSRESTGSSKKGSKTQESKPLVASEGAVDPTLAALFASSVSVDLALRFLAEREWLTVIRLGLCKLRLRAATKKRRLQARRRQQ